MYFRYKLQSLSLYWNCYGRQKAVKGTFFQLVKELLRLVPRVWHNRAIF